MTDALIGYSGFVGSNLDKQKKFDDKYNSSNINSISGKEFDLLVCAGISADKWWANRNEKADFLSIDNLLKIVKTVKVKKFVLISTIDVYSQPVISNELSVDKLESQFPYGKNRLYAERFIYDNFPGSLIIRLPGLFGNGLKKNFIFDLVNNAPRLIDEKKFNFFINEVGKNDKEEIFYNYVLADGFYQLKKNLNQTEHKKINLLFSRLKFNSLSFTDRDSLFQFYCLENIWKDISVALNSSISLLNIATEPVTAKCLANEVFDIDFVNKTGSKPQFYDMKSIHDKLFGGKNGYLYDKSTVFSELRSFLNQSVKK